MAGHILIADDDEDLTTAVGWCLEADGFTVTARHDGVTALEAFEAESADAVILDVMMPGMDGFQLCRRIRQMSNVPILMLSARDAEFDQVQALTIGADDYVTKPYRPMELVARVKALLRRSSYMESARMTFGALEVNKEQRQAFVSGQLVDLSSLEFDLLVALVSRPQRVLSREHLVSLVWEDFYGEERLVDAHIYKLRKKLTASGLDPCPIVTVRGTGYAFRP
jgi:DNA-binding response OmpR family regulator